MALALAGLAGLGLWSLLSSAWGHEVEQALTYANEWLSYAALLLLLLVLLRRPARATVLLGAVGLGITIVAVSVVVRLLGSDPGTMFIAGRLNSPLGYINGQGCVFAMGCWFGLALAERREAPLAGVGAGLTVLMAGLTLLSQSRGAAIATAVALLVALVAIPGARRRLLALAVIAIGFAFAAPSVVDVYSTAVGGVPASSVVHSAVDPRRDWRGGRVGAARRGRGSYRRTRRRRRTPVATGGQRGCSTRGPRSGRRGAHPRLEH
jgi:hypothetical protein